MNVVLKFERKPGCEYVLAPDGTLFEIEKKEAVIGKVEQKPGKVYVIKGDCVVEREVVKLDLDQYYEFKKTGKLAELFREGKEVVLEDENATLADMQRFEDQSFIQSIVDAKIVNVEVLHHHGETTFILSLDNGRKVVLKQGLLVHGSVVDVE